jgi:formylglycine-generating enzyme required for sulfatase activity
VREAIANDLVTVPAVYLAPWLECFRPVRARLQAPLAAIFRDAGRRDAERSLATDILAEYAADQPQMLADLLMDADLQQFAVLYPIASSGPLASTSLVGEIDKRVSPELPSADEHREKLAKRQANAAVALLKMNQPAKVWPLLKHGPDPRVRSYLIHRFGAMHADPAVLVKRLAEEPDVTIRQALILSLGPEEFGEEAWPPEGKKLLEKELKEIYRMATDPGLHAASEWLLRSWKQQAWLKQVNDEWAKGQVAAGAWRAGANNRPPRATPHWYVNTQGQTMVVIPGPLEFLMGSPTTEVGRQTGAEKQHRRRIGRTFALAAKAVTLEQYRRFDERYALPAVQTRTTDLPVVMTSWYQAAAYCNWLSKVEGIAEDQWSYEIKNEQLIKLKANYLSLTGYRLPTEAEMEYATRAGALTSRYYGETEELLAEYAWYNKNAQEKTWPVGSLKPNDLGLFDMHGNVWTWCQESFKADYPPAKGNEAIEDNEDGSVVASTDYRVLRGGSVENNVAGLRSASRDVSVPTLRFNSIGFRVAKTVRQ